MSALIAIGRWLLGGFGSLLGSVLGLVKRYPWQAACLALALACGHLSAGKADAEAGRDKAKAAATANAELLRIERVARGVDRAEWEKASAQAEAQWARTLADANTAARNKAEKADHDYKVALADQRARDDDNARRMRFDAQAAAFAATAGGAAGTAEGTAKGTASQGVDRPGADAVVVERADYDILNENTRRLIVAHDWAVAP